MIDIQTSKPPYYLAINKVGIKDIKHPVLIDLENNTTQATIASFDMMVALQKNERGTHMSRFVEILNQQQWILSGPCLAELLAITAAKLNTHEVYIKSSFEFFINKQAPVSKIAGLVNYKAAFSGYYQHNNYNITVIVPVTSLCPCSKEISDYGAHNQRSNITISIATNAIISLEWLVRLAEQQASCQLYSILKRVDEKYVTEYAYNNPKFAEDIVRNIANFLNNHPNIQSYTIESENFESIHNHSAYAMIKSS